MIEQLPNGWWITAAAAWGLAGLLGLYLAVDWWRGRKP